MTSHYLLHVDARRSVLCLLSGLVATWAFAGALGLITGVLSLGAAEGRLPWQSPILAGVMLALVVGLPMTVVTLTAAHGDSRSASTAMVAAGALIVWVLLQLVMLRELSWLQPVCVMLAIAVAALGAPAFEPRAGAAR
ncbi:hypothetical protein [Nocardia mangyaensis]|uniref:hypothetical protein n=1 Tax=Nocardia mangyaensis TaxID=2213200 RepID=UPI002676D6DE|nr:hypothetical protein [Nocardia mangyaensis]MDO3647699.1 hypothetical protein [Nocardia mangyaensis]